MCKSLVIAFVIGFTVFFDSYCQAQCTSTFGPSGSTYGTGKADAYDKYDGEIKVGTASLNSHYGWVNFWVGLTQQSGVTLIIDQVYIRTYTNEISTSSNHCLDYQEMTVDPFTASRTEIRNDIGSSAEYTYSFTTGQTYGWSPFIDLGPIAEDDLQTILNSGPGYFPVGFEEFNMDDNACCIDGRTQSYPPELKVVYKRIPDNPPNPTSNSPQCNSVTITRSGSPPAGVTWYWQNTSCGTSTSYGSGSTFTATSSGTYYIRARHNTCNDWSNGCGSKTVTIKINSTAPSMASQSPSSICPGESSNLWVSGGSLGTGASWEWYKGSCGGTYVGSGSSKTVYPTSTTTYYVRAEGDCNTTSCKSATVNVETNSTAPSSAFASLSSICSGQSSTLTKLGGSLGTNASWVWYSGSCGDYYEGSGSSTTVYPTSTTIYYVRAEGNCNTTSCKSATVTVKTNSTAPSSASASPNPVCLGSSTTLNHSGGVLGTGASWKWYKGSCGGTYVDSGSPSVSPTTNTKYYVRAEGDCNTTSCKDVTVVVEDCTDPTISFINSTSHDFGNINVNGYSSEFSFTLKNIGGGTATGSVSLTGSNANQFQITSGSGSFSLTASATKTIKVKFHPTLAGYKSATLFADGVLPCNDASASVSGNCIDAIEEISSKYITKIYPNPAFDKLNIEFTDNINKIEKITLSNMLGQTVYTIKGKKINTRNFVIDLSGYKSGVYYLNIRTKEDGTMRNKISIVR